MLGLARIQQLNDDADAAWTTLNALEALLDIGQNGRTLTIFRVFAARLALETGDLEGASDGLRDLDLTRSPISIETVSGSPTLTQARLLIAMGGDAHLAEASKILDALAAGSASINDSVQSIGILAVRALLSQTRGDLTTALQLVSEAAAVAAPGDHDRVSLRQETTHFWGWLFVTCRATLSPASCLGFCGRARRYPCRDPTRLATTRRAGDSGQKEASDMREAATCLRALAFDDADEADEARTLFRVQSLLAARPVAAAL